jgi:hypothetical protein
MGDAMTEYIKKNKKYMYSYIVTLIIFIIIVYLSYDPLALTTRGFMYLFIILIPILYLLIFVYVNYHLELFKSNLFYIFTLVLILLFIGTIYFYYKMSSTNILLFSYLIGFVLLLIILVGFIIFYNIFFEYLNKQTGNLGIFIQFIFYIPCLFNDLIKYILEQYHITPNIVFILFIFEILLILLYIYIPKLIHLLFKPSSNVLLMNPVYLNKQTDISGGLLSNLMILPPMHPAPLNKIPHRTNNFGISMWIYVNENITSHTEINIMNFCNGKTRIAYLNNKNNSNSYRIYYNDDTNKPYVLHLNHQKWNYFAFSYYLNNVDLFINGELTRTFTGNDVFNMTDYNIKIGQDDGLNGAICNILYYNKPLTKFQVAESYNLLINQNPPVIGLL